MRLPNRYSLLLVSALAAISASKTGRAQEEAKPDPSLRQVEFTASCPTDSYLKQWDSYEGYITFGCIDNVSGRSLFRGFLRDAKLITGTSDNSYLTVEINCPENSKPTVSATKFLGDFQFFLGYESPKFGCKGYKNLWWPSNWLNPNGWAKASGNFDDSYKVESYPQERDAHFARLIVYPGQASAEVSPR